MENITRNEFELLKICWKLKEATAKEILEESLKIKKRHYSTIKTLLDIMVRKEILKTRKIGPIYLYKVKTPKKRFITYMIDDFVDRVLEGDVVPLFINYIKKTNLTKEQREELRETLNTMKDD